METTPVRHRGPALALVVVAVIIAFVALLSLWVNRQLLNTENWTETSTQLIQEPEISNRVAGFLVDELYANVDIEGKINEVLPPNAQQLAAPLAGALRTVVDRAAREALTRPRAQQVWAEANRRAHTRLMQILAGGGPIVSTEGGEVTLDLKELLLQTEERAGIGGRLAGQLPPEAAQLTVLQSDELELAQVSYDWLRRLPVLLVALSLLLFGIALAVAPAWRRQAVRAYGIGLIVVGAASLIAVNLLGDYVTTSLPRDESGEPAVEKTWTLSTTLLREVGSATIFYGAMLLLGALLAGPTNSATSVRRKLAPYLRETAWAYGAMAALLLVVIVWWAPTPAMHRPVTAILIAVLMLLGFEALRRRTAQEFPDARLHHAEKPAPPAPPTTPATPAPA